VLGLRPLPRLSLRLAFDEIVARRSRLAPHSEVGRARRDAYAWHGTQTFEDIRIESDSGRYPCPILSDVVLCVGH